MFRKLVLHSLYSLALAGMFASLSAGLAACGGQTVASPTSTPAPTKTVTPTFTPTLDFLHLDRIPGLNPLTFAGQGEATTGEKYSLPQDVFAAARSRHLAPIEAEGGIASGCTSDSCTVMLTKYLVNGAQLQPATDGKVIYGFDGQAGSEALFRFSGLPEGVRATAFVSQEGNPWGYKPGTVVVWFWQGGSKGPTQILNQDNPLRIMADSPNQIQISSLDNGLVVTTIDANGTVIDEQRVAFLPSLPSEFLSQIPKDSYSYDANGLHLTVTEGQVIDIPQDQIAERLKVGQASPLQIYNEAGTAILFAWDAENKVLINAADVLQPDRNNPENYIKIQTWDDLKELARLEKMVLPPFPPDTYAWPTDKIIVAYQDNKANQDNEADFNFWRPLGTLEDLNKSPFKVVNFIVLPKNEDAGRSRDVHIAVMQVYNSDGSFSVLHFSNDYYSDRDRFVDEAGKFSSIGNYLLPTYVLSSKAAGADTNLFPQIGYLLDNGYLEADGSMPKIKALIEQWLTTGYVPPELENIPLRYSIKSFKK